MPGGMAWSTDPSKPLGTHGRVSVLLCHKLQEVWDDVLGNDGEVAVVVAFTMLQKTSTADGDTPHRLRLLVLLYPGLC